MIHVRLNTSVAVASLVAVLTALEASLQAAEVNTVFTYNSSITSGPTGPLALKAGLIYDDNFANAPIAVVMHSYSGDTGHFAGYYPNADRLRDLGFFAILVAMRQREGSEGRRDSGGLEIYDIFDAVEAVKTQFPGRVNPEVVYISGYSGGGGNTMSALTKFPDYFTAGAAFVGMSDYGYDSVNGWYFNGAGGRTAQLDIDVGVRTSNDPDVIDRYHARASNLASKNNPYSQIYLFANQAESISPIINNVSYRDNAIAAAAFAGEFDNIRFVNGQSGVSYEDPGKPLDWVDWNSDGVIQQNERQDYPHSNALIVQERGERWFLDDLLAGNLPRPQLNPTDDLFVAGYVRTRPFQIWLGDGQNAAGEFEYSLGEDAMSFSLAIASLNKSITGALTIYENTLRTARAHVELNGQIIGEADLSKTYVFNGLGHGDQLRLLAVPEPASVHLCACVVVTRLLCVSKRRRDKACGRIWLERRRFSPRPPHGCVP